MPNEEKEALKKIMETIEEIKQNLKTLTDKVDELSKKQEQPFIPLRGNVINLEYTKKQVFDYLKSQDKPLSAKDISEGVRISRSHASAVLNELFREGKVKKLRERREIKFVPADKI